MVKKIRINLYPIFLVLIALFLAFQNYTPDTYLSGWDTLHPEFNFGLNFERVLSGVFRQEQGLGAVAAHSHMAEIPRILELFILHFIFPTDTLRYISILSSLIIGSLGMYFFLNKLLKNKLFAFSGGLFYLLNLGTLQQFIVPFEMFTTQYAFLPWLFLFITEYLISGNKKTLLFFSIATLLATPMAYAATLWYGYFISLVLFLFIFAITNKDRQNINRSLKLILVTLLVNSFWLLPNIYFILNHAKEVSDSKINTLFTQEAFAQNVSFGNLPSLALFKGFLFNWGVYAGNNTFNQLLEVWIKHLENPFVKALGYSFFTIILIGIASNIKKRGKFILPAFSLFILSFFFLLNINPPLGFIFQFIQEHIPFFREAIRFPFTKFSIIFIFSSSIFFAYGISFLNNILQKIKLKHSNIFISLFIVVSLIYYMFPAFSGNFVSPYMRISIPKEYFELSNWFSKQPQGRIANLPIHSFWGWEYYNWYDNKPSFQGAGFLWFGIKQPILNRDFDRWNSLNEEYYREISYAIYKQDVNLFSLVLSKYNISYILLDKSIIAPGSDPKVLFFNEIQNLIKKQSLIKEGAQFGKNIFVYKVPSKNNIYTLNNYKTVTPQSDISYEDFAYEKYGDYVSSSKTSDIYIPFRNLIDNQNKFLKDKVVITQQGASVTVPEKLKNHSLNLPRFEELEKSAASDMIVEKIPNNTLKITFFPKFPKSPVPLTTSANLPYGEKNFLININQKSFTLNNLAENNPFSLGTVFLNTNSQNNLTLYQDKNDIQIIPDFSTINSSVNSCGLMPKGVFSINNQNNNLYLFAKDTDLCMMTPLSEVTKRYETLQGEEFLIGIKYNLSQTSDSSLCIANLKNGSCINYGLKSGDFVFFEVKKIDVENLGLKIIMEASESKQGEKLSYTNVLITLKKPIFSVKFSKDVLKLSFDYLKTIKDSSINIAFPESEQYNRDITSLSKTNGDCQTSQGPLAPKKQIVKQEFKNYIRYTAEEGSFCDHFSYQNLPQDQAYIIAIQSRNIKGLPIRLCVNNQSSKRCDLYTHLSVSSDFTQDVFLLPPMSDENNPGNGFDININNLGIKNVPSINDLSSIYIIPFPYYWLSKIEVINPKENGKQQILALSESYENGWKAYEVKDNNFLINIFPFIFGKEIKDHVLVNNWANGWSLNNEAMKQSSNRVVIVFLPQYLEYLGFVILIISTIYIIKKRRLD